MCHYKFLTCFNYFKSQLEASDRIIFDDIYTFYYYFFFSNDKNHFKIVKILIAFRIITITNLIIKNVRMNALNL